MLNRTAVRIARIVGGIAFLILGVIGLFLPFLQGILFLVIGLTLLSQESDRARVWSEWLRGWLPQRSPRDGENEEE